MTQVRRPEIQFPINSPIKFEYDPGTALLSVRAVASVQHLQTPIEIPLRLMLTPQTSQSLLADLPKLESLLLQATIESLLLQATKGRAKPDFLQ